MIKVAYGWDGYKIIATGDGQKLEKWDGLVLLRPDPQVIWKAKGELARYKGINAIYNRSSQGGGDWTIKDKTPTNFVMERGGLRFNCKLMGFKHTGLFPEQAVNWDLMQDIIKKTKRQLSVLNLFAYTGGATVACAKAGAKVCHVDSARAMVDRAKDNCESSGVARENVRFIIDDCMKFVEREIRRGIKYDAIIMDPPSYGRGANGEVWKIEEHLFDLVKKCAEILSDKPAFFLINSYTTGLQPTVIRNILQACLDDKNGDFDAYEVGLPTEERGIILPCGCSGLFVGK